MTHDQIKAALGEFRAENEQMAERWQRVEVLEGAP